MKKIVLTGGGTAGHVTPNIALLPALKEAGYEKEIDKMCGISKEEETEPKLDIELETEVETK